jgi:glucosyl-dolichyl phosphate glucuronosyltransferase
VKISVILCTRNRCAGLGKALDGVAASQLPDCLEWEVLVVDNDSTDRTREVVEEFCRRHPEHFRYLFEPHPGKAYALNTGVQQAQGEILAFVDDDVTVEPTWLYNLTSSLQDGNCSGTGGRILPETPIPPAKWFSLDGDAMGPLVIFDQGDLAGPLFNAPYGTNMAFRKAMFEKYGPFRVDLSPLPGDAIKNEDVEFGLRLLGAGEPLRYEPSAVVYHWVKESRITKSYMRRWHFDKGRSDMRLFGARVAGRWSICGISLRMLRRPIRWSVQSVLTVDPRKRFACTLKVCRAAGEIVECFRLWRNRSASRANTAMKAHL